MKTYKTWELLKIAEETTKEERKNRKFVNKEGRIVRLGESCLGNTGLFVEPGILAFKGNLMNEQWEEVQQPVSFMEAAKSGKKARVKHKDINLDKKYTEEYSNIPAILHVLALDYNDEKVLKIITEGEWFIKGE